MMRFIRGGEPPTIQAVAAKAQGMAMAHTIARRIGLAVGLLCGAATAQAPEYAQQYRQRLGGARAELDGIVAGFQGEAARHGLDFNGAVARLANNADPLASARGKAMESVLRRRDALADQSRDMDDAGPMGRIFVILRHPDPAIAQGAWAAFEPALPLTPDALLASGLGMIAGYGVFRLISLPLTRRRRPARA